MLVVGIIVAGAFLGINNTLITEAVMGAAPVERPVASAAYSFVRFSGGAIAPYAARQARRERQHPRAVLDGRRRRPGRRGDPRRRHGAWCPGPSRLPAHSLEEAEVELVGDAA